MRITDDRHDRYSTLLYMSRLSIVIDLNDEPVESRLNATTAPFCPSVRQLVSTVERAVPLSPFHQLCGDLGIRVIRSLTVLTVKRAAYLLPHEVRGGMCETDGICVLCFELESGLQSLRQ